MADKEFGLSRRKVLVGLGAVGVASAGAGLGMTAYFSDEESFVGNSLTAGELDLYVHVDYSEDQGSFAQWSTPAGTYVQGGVIGESVSDEETGISLEEGEPLSIQVVDLKPGDSGEGEFCFSIVDNPAYMWMCGELTANDQNGTTEPEEAALEELFGEIPDDGQLADAMEVTLSYCTEGETNEEIVSGSLAEVMAALQAGVPLYGDGNPDAPVANRPAFEGVDTPFVEDEPNTAQTCVCFEWEVPTTVGNEIQTDSVEFDFSFYAEQERHNDGLTNPCVVTREGEGWGKAEEELEEPSWHARGIYGDGGGAANRELDIRDPDDLPIHSGDENYAWQNGQAVPFSLTIDGGDAKWNVDGTEVLVDDAPLPVADGIGVTVKTRDADASITVEDVMLNGSSPTGADSVSASGSATTNYLMIEGATLQEGDVVSGMVTMSWNATPGREDIGFRVDV
ncbi:choice-of-anchor W domain-containing protein [Halalkaliarchaeum desulfuricum]|nr:choice-of-anchor W domain-containing protein [Halalkaliarchaeum desulfuricum]